ncbi:MAG: glycoside hydrolase family 92 protein, partial [Prolixibacteraceae bacterium]|nr:glycoside hydrolase family 92 protein [Prolixibacteraceae bacterium]
EEVRINLENGNVFTIKADNCSEVNKYIQSAWLNGEPLNCTWFTHEDLINGATIELEMGAKPNKEWGAEKSAAPPSKLETANF